MVSVPVRYDGPPWVTVKRPIGIEGYLSWSLTFGEFAYLTKRLLSLSSRLSFIVVALNWNNPPIMSTYNHHHRRIAFTDFSCR